MSKSLIGALTNELIVIKPRLDNYAEQFNRSAN